MVGEPLYCNSPGTWLDQGTACSMNYTHCVHNDCRLLPQEGLNGNNMKLAIRNLPLYRGTVDPQYMFDFILDSRLMLIANVSAEYKTLE